MRAYLRKQDECAELGPDLLEIEDILYLQSTCCGLYCMSAYVLGRAAFDNLPAMRLKLFVG